MDGLLLFTHCKEKLNLSWSFGTFEFSLFTSVWSYYPPFSEGLRSKEKHKNAKCFILGDPPSDKNVLENPSGNE